MTIENLFLWLTVDESTYPLVESVVPESLVAVAADCPFPETEKFPPESAFTAELTRYTRLFHMSAVRSCPTARFCGMFENEKSGAAAASQSTPRSPSPKKAHWASHFAAIFLRKSIIEKLGGII
jgi:hypothetical protein